MIVVVVLGRRCQLDFLRLDMFSGMCCCQHCLLLIVFSLHILFRAWN